MRKFGKDKPELMKFQIEGSDKVYAIPLAASLPAADLIEMSEADGDDVKAFKFMFKLLKRYMGDDADNLTASEISDIIAAWNQESEKQGAEVGE